MRTNYRPCARITGQRCAFDGFHTGYMVCRKRQKVGTNYRLSIDLRIEGRIERRIEEALVRTEARTSLRLRF